MPNRLPVRSRVYPIAVVIALLPAFGIAASARAQLAPPPDPGQPPTVTSTVTSAAPSPQPAAAASDPIAGVSDGTMFLRSPDDAFVFFPNGRLQLDTYVFHSGDKTPNDTFLIRRARLELSGWISGVVFFHIAGDFAAGVPATSGVSAVQTNLNTTDAFVALAPFGTIAMLQVGQYDAPFTLENRTSDKYFDFMERSITVRAFGIPDNKEVGTMVHGYDSRRRFMYSVGLFNGDGQNFRNLDTHFDWMGRAWIAPFAFTGDGPLHDVTIGGSFWSGERANTLAPASQTTQGGFTFLSFAQFTTPMTSAMPMTPVQLRQNGALTALATELNVPVAHKYGLRYELVWRDSALSEDSIAANGSGTSLGGAKLRGHSMYGELWYWAIGDDLIIGDQQGLEPYPRYKRFGVAPPRNGLMLAARFEYLNEDVTEDAAAAALALGNPAIGKTRLTSYELGANYWRSKRFRASFNYVLNHFDRGPNSTPFLAALSSANEQEFLLRLAIAL